jgi:hypothetical protein
MHKVDIVSRLENMKADMREEYYSTVMLEIDSLLYDLSADSDVISQKGRE